MTRIIKNAIIAAMLAAPAIGSAQTHFGVTALPTTGANYETLSAESGVTLKVTATLTYWTAAGIDVDAMRGQKFGCITDPSPVIKDCAGHVWYAMTVRKLSSSQAVEATFVRDDAWWKAIAEMTSTVDW